LTSALTNQGPYEFAVSGAGDNYIDLANTYLFVEAHIMDDDDTALDGGADVGPVNLWMHSLFSDVSSSIEAPSTSYLWGIDGDRDVTGSCITGSCITGNDVTGSREPEMKGR
jgi:hypothetical protein